MTSLASTSAFIPLSDGASSADAQPATTLHTSDSQRSFLAQAQSEGVAFLFPGQGSPWVEALAHAASLPRQGAALRALWSRARQALAPVARDLLIAAPGAHDRLDAILAAGPEAEQPSRLDSSPAASMPGIVLAQYAAILDLEEAGFDWSQAGEVPILGHSQGYFATSLVKAVCAGDQERAARVVAEAALTGTAAAWQTAQLAGSVAAEQRGSAGAYMVSVRRVPRELVAEALADAEAEQGGQAFVSINNGSQALVLSGVPAQLARVQRGIARRVDEYNVAIEARERGGAALNPVIEELPFGAPFHSPLLEAALEKVTHWLDTLIQAGRGFDRAAAIDIARHVLVAPIHWPAALDEFCMAHLTDQTDGSAAMDGTSSENGSAEAISPTTGTSATASSATDGTSATTSRATASSPATTTSRPGLAWLIDLGPGQMLTSLTAPVVAGTGIGVVSAGDRAARLALGRPGSARAAEPSWGSFAPKVVRLPGGRVVLDTAFSRLTGYSPIMLPGMTPTTAWPEIVAAAANAGHWAELAGGGQYNEEVFTERRERLQQLLRPGRTAGFNAMFFDRYMWNLQFGPGGIVPKARRTGAPIDAVTIAAGVPELEEALKLIAQLRADGFRFICFKPGTVEQIGQVLAIARALEKSEGAHRTQAHTPAETAPGAAGAAAEQGDGPRPFTLIIQVEDGHSGGHHSWEDLDQLLLATYAQIRQTPNVVLAVGGGIGRPQDAVAYLSGQWSRVYHRPAMPVDAVMVGTATMATLEAGTSPQVKQLLVETPGIPREHHLPASPVAPETWVTGRDSGGWVGRGRSRGGMTSGLSHLGADMHEVDNSSARASRLIHELGGSAEAIAARREEIIEALAATAKPYFGDVETMTYAQWVQRFVQLCYPSADPTWEDRALDLFQRVEARLHEADHGEIETLFGDVDAVADGEAALQVLLESYPQAHEVKVAPSDVAWFPVLCRKHHKPLPFVPVLDAELAKWWGTDTLWQSHDPRFSADSVRVIPGPRSVAGIDRVNEPIGELFGRFEQAVVDWVQAQGVQPRDVVARLGAAESVAAWLRTVPSLQWAGTVVSNPAAAHPASADICDIERTEAGWRARVVIRCDTAWDELDGGSSAPASDTGASAALPCPTTAPFAVRAIDVPLLISEDCATGALPVVDMEVLSRTAYDLLAGAAGVGSVSINGDAIEALPPVVALQPTDGSAQAATASDPAHTPGSTASTPRSSEGSAPVATASLPAEAPFGIVRDTFTFSAQLGSAHAQSTGAAVPGAALAAGVPDALVGPCWPAIYAALGSAQLDGIPVIEGLVNAVHLDHTVRLVGALPAAGTTVSVLAWCAQLAESSAGRVVRVELSLCADGEEFAQLVERFAIRNRIGSTAAPSPAPQLAAASDASEIVDTQRSFLARVTVTAPSDMTAFANVSGDYNPIHTSTAAAQLAGLEAPLVHGMWLSATAQHAISARLRGDGEDAAELASAAAAGAARAVVADGSARPIRSWSYQMYGMVNLGDEVEITIERVAHQVHPAGGDVLEATCRVGGEVVSIGKALVAAPRTAYVFPGQGIQRPGMGLDNASAVAREVWARADRHTREALGFSILSIVRDNPTEIVIDKPVATGGAAVATTAHGAAAPAAGAATAPTAATATPANPASAPTTTERQVFKHPKGVLYLTQFTQVALATLAYAQVAELRADGVFDEQAVYAGHSLGEYNALAACAGIFPFEKVLDIVYQRGSAMHHLVPRDAEGRSNYQLGALRPNQCGLRENEVTAFVAQVAASSGEFVEIVNYNLAGSQYAVAGTVAGLAAVQTAADALAEAHGGRRAFILIPGIDVPFHSAKLRAGVAPFREKLDELLPEELDYRPLVGRYVPNLVARPFELTASFARAIVEVVPSAAVQALLDAGWAQAVATPQATTRTARTLLVELLAWQFASPVRWIETQDLFFTGAPRGLSVQRIVEIGLASSPTLANMAAKTLTLPRHQGLDVQVLNSERDHAVLTGTDARPTPARDDAAAGSGARDANGTAAGNGTGADTATTSGAAAAQEDHSASAPATSPAASATAGEHAPAATADPATSAASTVAATTPAASESNTASSAGAPASGGENPDLPFTTEDAVRMLLAWANKLRPEQIEAGDTVDTLTNGVSSKRNQLLMDLAAELSVSTIDGAAEATMRELFPAAAAANPGYTPFGPVLSEVVNSRLTKLLGSAGVNFDKVAARVTDTWGLRGGWVQHVAAALVLGTRDGSSLRGGDLGTLAAAAASVTTPAAGNELIDQAISTVAAARGITVSRPGAGGGAGTGGTVDAAVVEQITSKILGEDGVLAAQARDTLRRLGIEFSFTETSSSAAASPTTPVATPVLPGTAEALTPGLDVANPAASEAAALALRLEQELGAGWLKTVQPVFDPARAVLFDDRWALAREDIARIASGQADLGEMSVNSFAGCPSGVADLAQWYLDRGLVVGAPVGSGTGEAPSNNGASTTDHTAPISDRTAREDFLRAVIAEVSHKKTTATSADTAPYLRDTALVTGAAPGSIAERVVAGLLAGGATVVMTASRVDANRLAFAKRLYRRWARAEAQLWLVPANLSSLADVEALVEWVTTDYVQTTGATSEVVKPALQLTLFFPFAAPRVFGRMGEDPRAAMNQERLLLWSVERTIALLASVDDGAHVGQRLHVVLPGSPNRGTFGGDGAYGQAKASFDTIVNKWRSESGWPQRVSIAHPQIGWVAGTHLMSANDGLVPAARRAGIRVYSTTEMASELLALVSPEVRAAAATEPVVVDLSGGLSQTPIDLAALAAEAAAAATTNQTAQMAQTAQEGRTSQTSQKAQTSQATPATESVQSAKTAHTATAAVATESTPSTGKHRASTATPRHIQALPNRVRAAQPAALPWGEVTRPLDEQVVIVGLGEISSWGSGRTRQNAEFGEQLTELTAAGVMELAWMMGLIRWEDSPTPGWYDRSGAAVPESEIWERFHDEVALGCGIRPLDNDGSLIGAGSDDETTVYLHNEQRFAVDTRAQAEAFAAADPAHTRIGRDADGRWVVIKPAGSPVRVPRRATLTRTVAAQIPADFDPTRWGIPASMVEAMDRIALWNLVSAVDAFIGAGFSPAELLAAVHPADVSSTQGTGIGGMESLRKVFLDRFLGEDRPQDILQEALPNVVAAHTMQSYIGGYGQMVHPVGACATAAVSVEEAVDKIVLGKSDVVIAGGIDDISVESLTGFGDMNATADSAVLAGRGIDPRFFSRAGDRRRAGFLEAMGGGTVILARGSVAADLGLPVLGVVAYARSFADGAHTSIPAPGVGAAAAGQGGVHSQFVRELASLGATPDDITVVSKHDTSTLANDPNEAELHSTLARAWGRSAGNPLYVVSQKTLTGHAKGGAALLQLGGMVDMFTRQEIPANRALDCLDPAMAPYEPLVWLRHPLAPAGGVRGAVLTSLGFGHVSALVAVLHPTAFEQAVRTQRGEAAAEAWRAQASSRLAAGRDRLEAAMVGKARLFEPIAHRRLPEHGAHAAEIAMLLDPQARLVDGDVVAGGAGSTAAV